MRIVIAKWNFGKIRDNIYEILPDRLMVGHRPLEAGILVRIQVWQLFFAKATE